MTRTEQKGKGPNTLSKDRHQGVQGKGGGSKDKGSKLHVADDQTTAGHAHSHTSRHEQTPTVQERCHEIDEKRSHFIEENLEDLQKKCNSYSACTQALYKGENYHRILSGENLRLQNICGLLYANGGENYTVLNKECSVEERQAIKDIIGEKLKDKLDEESSRNAPWKTLKTCVSEDKTAIDKVCSDKKDSDSNVCDNEKVDKVTSDFFNQQLELQHCFCVAIESRTDKGGSKESGFMLPVAVRLAIGGGVFALLLLLVIAVVILFVRHRKTTRKLKEHRLRYVNTAISSRDEPSVIYQEISDLRTAPQLPSRQKDEGKLLPHGYELTVAPSVPERYVKGMNLLRVPQANRLPSDDDDRPHSYLEPLADPVLGPSGLGRPPTDSQGSQGRSQAGIAGKEGGAYSLAKHVGECHPPGTPYSLAKHVGESHPDASGSASGGYSLAKRLDHRAPAGAQSSGGGEGTYFDTIKLTKGKAEDEFGYAKLRCTTGSIKNADAERESSTQMYFELEAERESTSELRNSEHTSSTKL